MAYFAHVFEASLCKQYPKKEERRLEMTDMSVLEVLTSSVSGLVDRNRSSSSR
jgi:hypothetical protein